MEHAFVSPETYSSIRKSGGGSADSADCADSADSKLKSPHCVVVRFDELNFPDGKNPFFPEGGARRFWVPIFRQKVFSSHEAAV